MLPLGAGFAVSMLLTWAADGVLNATVTLAGASMANLLDADGAALVIHASPDDYKTDPSGNSGARIACAVIRPVAEMR